MLKKLAILSLILGICGITILRIYLQAIRVLPPYDFKDLRLISLGLLAGLLAFPPISLDSILKLRKRLRELKNDENGIVTVVGLVLFFITLILVVNFLPLIMGSISYAKGVVADKIGRMVLDLVIPMLFIGFIVSYLIYAGAAR